MATFELNSDMLNSGRAAHGERFERDRAHGAGHTAENNAPFAEVEGLACGPNPPPAPVKQESIIALKIYDSCRQQDCLDEEDLGAARACFDQHMGGKHYGEGEIIITPDNAASVSVDDLRVKKIIIVSKRHNPFKRGFWDIELKFVFEYTLILREACGKEIGCLVACSVFNKTVTLFGSIGSDIVIATDLLSDKGCESPALGMDPFVLVEAKAVALSARLRRHKRRGNNEHHDHCEGRSAEVVVTIGLFTIVKLFRIVTLLVESRGFAVPRNCQEFTPINVCDYFDRLPFPMDVFSPPQRREFEAGISGDVPRMSVEERSEEFVETEAQV